MTNGEENLEEQFAACKPVMSCNPSLPTSHSSHFHMAPRLHFARSFPLLHPKLNPSGSPLYIHLHLPYTTTRLSTHPTWTIQVKGHLHQQQQIIHASISTPSISKTSAPSPSRPPSPPSPTPKPKPPYPQMAANYPSAMKEKQPRSNSPSPSPAATTTPPLPSHPPHQKN